MAEACEALATPVVSGNVSFYNESFGKAIYPTPVVGMLGVYDDVSLHLDHGFKDEGDLIVLLGPDAAWLDGSEYQKVHYGRVEGRVPGRGPRARAPPAGGAARGHRPARLKSAHDCAEGGLAVALAEMRHGQRRRRAAPASPTPRPRSGRARPLPRRRRRPWPRPACGADLALFGEGADARGGHRRAGRTSPP